MIRFRKVESVGNDFPLFFLEELPADEPALTDALRRLSVVAADRRFGIGGDGILAMARQSEGLNLRMFNPDGTEDFCGNGIRCAAWAAHDMGWVGSEFSVQHGGRPVPCKIEGEMVRSTLGTASYDPAKVPATRGPLADTTIWEGMDGDWPLHFFGSALTTGSTHAVLPVGNLPDDESFRWISARIEHSPLFPLRTSVVWVQETAPMKLRIRIWERGVGETLGCGTGSSAAAVDYLRRKGGGGRVEVVNPGGTLWVEMRSWEDPLDLIGAAKVVYEGDYEFPCT